MILRTPPTWEAFFADLLSRGDLRSVSPSRGRFRSFLLACCCNFPCKDRRREASRGPAPISIDSADAGRTDRVEPADTLTPEQHFDRRWALSLLRHALDGLRDEYGRPGKEEVLARLRPTLAGEPPPGGHAAAAEALGMSEGAAHVAAYRLRRRYRDSIRDLVADTVESPDQVEGEIRDLFSAIARPRRCQRA